MRAFPVPEHAAGNPDVRLSPRQQMRRCGRYDGSHAHAAQPVDDLAQIAGGLAAGRAKCRHPQQRACLRDLRMQANGLRALCAYHEFGLE